MIPTSPPPTPAGCCRNPPPRRRRRPTRLDPAQVPASRRRRRLGGVALNAFGDRFGLGHLGFDLPDAFATTPIGAHDGILVNIVLYGGNDGLNTVVPYTNAKYYDVRGPSNGNLAIPAGQVLPLDGTFGLHPSLTLHQAACGMPANWPIVHGVGYPNPDLSHFTSMAIWMNGRFGVGPPSTGWVGRWLDGQPAATADLMAATIGSSVPLHLLGAVRRAVAVPENGNGMFGTGDRSGGDPHVQRAACAGVDPGRARAVARHVRRRC